MADLCIVRREGDGRVSRFVEKSTPARIRTLTRRVGAGDAAVTPRACGGFFSHGLNTDETRILNFQLVRKLCLGRHIREALLRMFQVLVHVFFHSKRSFEKVGSQTEFGNQLTRVLSFGDGFVEIHNGFRHDRHGR